MMLLLGAAVAATAFAHASSASAAVRPTKTVSGNWSGYAVTGGTYSDVKGTWVQPAVTCAGGTTYSSFWVGLGGYTSGSRALEQTGTEADCRGGRPSYSAWYELVPAASVSVPLAVSAGDTISAEVSVAGGVVTLSLLDVTTGQSFSVQKTPTSLSVDSAEWVAEAPSTCTASGRCSTLPLANFGTVAFSGAAAATADGHSGLIADGAWSADPISLGSIATPSSLGADGASFTVSTAGQPTPSAGAGGGRRSLFPPWWRRRGHR